MSRFNEEQIVGVERSGGWSSGGRALLTAGRERRDVYRWKAKYGGLELNEVRQLRSGRIELAGAPECLYENSRVVKRVRATMRSSFYSYCGHERCMRNLPA